MKKKVTKHGKKRIRGRVGVKNANYMYRLARQRGKKGKDIKGDFGRLLKFLEIKSNGRTIVYNGFIYIVKFGKLITVLNIPYKYQDWDKELKNEK